MARDENASDQEMFRLLREGHADAFAELFRRHWKDMYLHVLKIIADEALAQDIVQDIFISLWNRRADLEVAFPRSYLLRSARLAVLKVIRDQKVSEAFYARLRAISVDLVEEQPLLFKEQQALLEQLIGALPEQVQETFRMSREQQLTYKQIAEQLQISEKTVEKRMSKALKFLRENLSLSICVAILML